MSDLATRIREYYDAAAEPVEAAEIFARLEVELKPVRRRFRNVRPVLVAVAAAVVVLVVVGAAAWFGLLGGSEEFVDEPAPVTTTVPAPTVTTVPTAAAGYDLDAALGQVAQFHTAWNSGSVRTIVDLLHPESAYRADRGLIEIATSGFHAVVDADCSAAPGSDSDRAEVTCVETVEDDFYTAVGIHLTTEVVYEVTADGIDVLEGDPIWSIKATGTAFEFLKDFDMWLAEIDGDVTDVTDWIWLEPSSGTPNWDGASPRAYSVESVFGAERALLTYEFVVWYEDDPWEPLPVVSEPVIPEPQSQVSTCRMPAELPDGVTVEPWFVELHGAVSLLVDNTNGLGSSLTKTEDFTAGWDRREPVASALALVIEDLDNIETIGVAFLVDSGATYSDEAGWVFPDTGSDPIWYQHVPELLDGISYNRDAVLPAFFEMRSQGTAIAYFNSGGVTAGPCGAAAGAVLLVDTMLNLR